MGRRFRRLVFHCVLYTAIMEPKFVERGVKINGENFLDLLQNHYAPNMALAYGGVKKFRYRHDNAPAHSESRVKEWVSKHLKSFDWPSSSPDLSPLDYGIWSILDTKVQSLNPKNVPELKMAIIRACREIPMDVVRSARFIRPTRRYANHFP